MTQQGLGQRDDTLALLKSNLQFAQARMKRYTDKGRKDVAFQVVQRVGEVAYRLDLPPSSKIHPVFHISILRRCLGTPNQQVTPIILLDHSSSLMLSLKSILDSRTITRGAHQEIRVGLELSDYGMQQRLIPYMHFIGELYNYELIDSSVLFRGMDLLSTNLQLHVASKSTEKKISYYFCVIEDQSTHVEYRDHNFEPVPFASCNLKYFVSALDGEVPSEIIPMWTLSRLMHMFSSSKLAAPDSGGDQDELELNDYEMRQRHIAHMCFPEDLFNYELVDFAVAPFEKIHGLCPCMLSPTKIIVGLGLSLRIDILIAFGATVDCRILLTSKATAIARAILAPLLMVICSLLNLQAIDDAGHDRASVYKVKELEAVDCAIEKLARLLWA
ncbi:putative actin-depolymerizing factor 2-like [Capsicum annuum]|nr:putative actin-depolymerizing factor 2-like [Capsicum annuum]